MQMVRTLVLLPVVFLAGASWSLAQVDPPPAVQRYLVAQGGAALDADFEHPTAVLGAEYGERVTRSVFAYMSLHYVDNLMSPRMRDNLALAGEVLTAIEGVPWEFRGRDRGIAFSVGAKYMISAGTGVRPYIGAGVGLLSLQRTITERDLGDVSHEFYGLTGLNDGIFDTGRTSATKPLVEGAVGVGGAVGRAYVDVAYRYRRGFHSFEEIGVSQLTFGVGARWR